MIRMTTSMKIAIVTQNLEEAKSIPAMKLPAVAADILVVATQEDGRSLADQTFLVNSKLNAKTVSIQGNLYTLLGSIALNPRPFAKNVQLRVYGAELPSRVETGRLNVPAKRSVSSLMQRGARLAGVMSKGCVWAKIFFGDSELLFVNCHLPMHKKESGLGFQYRKESFTKILNTLVKDGVIEDTTTVFLTGDLNFRVDPGEAIPDQLTRILPELPVHFEDLAELAPESVKSVTCKLEHSSNSACRTQNVNNITNKSCIDPNRIPSRCDRILVKTLEPLRVASYRTEVLNEIFDHNAVIGVVELGVEPNKNINTVTGVVEEEGPLSHNNGYTTNTGSVPGNLSNSNLNNARATRRSLRRTRRRSRRQRRQTQRR